MLEIPDCCTAAQGNGCAALVQGRKGGQGTHVPPPPLPQRYVGQKAVQLNRLSRGKPRGAIRPADARAPIHSARSVSVRVPPAGSFQAKASRQNKGGGIRQPTVLVFLQPHALALGHLGQFGQREHQHLAVIAHHGDMIALHLAADGGFDACAQRQHLLARTCLRQHLIRGDDKAVARQSRPPAAFHRGGRFADRQSRNHSADQPSAARVHPCRAHRAG